MSKSSLEALFGTDPNKVSNGVVVKYGTISVRLASLSGANKNFGKIFEEKSRPWRQMIAADLLPPEVAETIMFESFAEAIVLGWEGVTCDDGNAIDFTPAACVDMFKKYPAFFTFCKSESEKRFNFVADTDVKN